MVLDTITEALRTVIKNAMRTVTSADAAYKLLKTEFAAPRQLIRNLWNEIARNDSYTTLLNTWDRTKPVPRGWTTPTDQRQLGKYQYVFQVKYYNTTTQQYEMGLVSNYQERLISFQDAWDAFGDALDYLSDIYGLQIVSWRPDSVKVEAHP